MRSRTSVVSGVGERSCRSNTLRRKWGPARHFGNAASIQAVIAGIGIRLEEAAKAGEMRLWMSTGAVGREAVPRRGRRRAAGSAVVGRIDPQSPGRGLATAGVEHRHRRVVGVDLVGLEHRVADAADDRVEQRRGLPGPAGERGAVDAGALRRHHLRLAVQRQVVVELRHDDMRQRRERRLATCNGLGRCGRLNDLLA